MDDGRTKSLDSLIVPVAFTQMQKSLPPVLPKRVCQVSLRYIANLPKGDLQNMKGHLVKKFQYEEVRLLSLDRTEGMQRDLLASEEGLQLMKVFTPTVIIHLS